MFLTVESTSFDIWQLQLKNKFTLEWQQTFVFSFLKNQDKHKIWVAIQLFNWKYVPSNCLNSNISTWKVIYY